MKIISLNLKNFQGIKDLSIYPNGESIDIYGDNGTGKTTVFNAFTWLLFDKPSTGAKNFTPKTKSNNGEVHGLDHTASAVIEHNGKRISLTKTYREIYKKKRGSIHEEFDGHTTEYFVDGVPTKEKEYAETVSAMWGTDAELAKILTTPEYFSEILPWEKRRAILLELCGGVTDDEVFASNESLSVLKDALEGRSVEDLGKILHAKKTAVNKRLSELPGRLDEAQRGTAFMEIFSIESAQRTLGDLEDERRDLMEERAHLAHLAAEKKRKQLASLEVKMSEAAAAYGIKCIESASGARAILESAKDQLTTVEREIRYTEAQRKEARDKKEALNRRRTELLDEYGKVAALVFDESTTICPCCKRALPDDEIAKLREEFNLSKSTRLSEINEKGKREASREMIAACEVDIKEISERIHSLNEALMEAKRAVQKSESEIPDLPPFEDTDTYREIMEKINAVRDEVSDKEKTHAEAIAEQDGKIRAINDRANAIRDDIARYNAALRSKERVDELIYEQKTLAKEYEEAEHLTYLCELFIKTKVSLLTEQINSRFENVRFSLFSEQINGGLKEECESLIPSTGGALVPYAFANHAARINAGIEIIKTISQHFGVEMPLFVDNAESVTHIVPGTSQKIRLVVSEKDKSLRVVPAC